MPKKLNIISTDDDINHTSITSSNGAALQRMEDFRYLRSFVVDSVKTSRKVCIKSGNQISLYQPK